MSYFSHHKSISFLSYFICGWLFITQVHAEQQKITVNFQNVGIDKVMAMLSEQQQVNIVLTEGVDEKVSINLYNMALPDVIQAISRAAGYAVEKQNGIYYIVERDNVGKYYNSGMTQIRSFKVQYSNPADVERILKKHLSNYGKITLMEKRRILVVEDLPSVLNKIEKLIQEVDVEPRQILIEAKILEVTLTDGESFGLDWTYFFNISDGAGRVGTRQLGNPRNAGLFLDFLGPNLKIALDALKERGRLRTLSTPTLLAMEDQTAETQVGTRLGYSVTTTINQVTTESIEFLETGIILKVTPSVDDHGMINLEIHPEVSDGSVSDDGIPSKTTTQITTNMLVADGQTVFLGGLIKRNITESNEGVPLLSDVPIMGNLFSNKSERMGSTEIVVLITPTIVNFKQNPQNLRAINLVNDTEAVLESQKKHVEKGIIRKMDKKQRKYGKNKNKAKKTPVSAQHSKQNVKHTIPPENGVSAKVNTVQTETTEQTEASDSDTGIWILDQ